MINKINRNCYLLIFSFITSILFAFDYNLSLESKYGQGTQVSPVNEKKTPGYIYSEHILDLNFNFNSGFYLYSQIEYSSPPIKGFNFTGINNYHLEYIGFLTSRRNWLAGSSLTCADLAAGAQLSVIDYLGDVPWCDHSDAKNWYARLKSRPSFQPLLEDSLPGVRPSKIYADLDF